MKHLKATNLKRNKSHRKAWAFSTEDDYIECPHCLERMRKKDYKFHDCFSD